jgi:hypothetical protein
MGAIGDLKKLHFLSAGRSTRSDRSWNLQESPLGKQFCSDWGGLFK